jgi:uncharacterized protein with GYD domain
MPKYLIQGSYTPEGLRGLAKDKASGRKAAVQASLKAVKAKLESYYFTFGADDFVIIIEAPDNVTMAAVALAVGATGTVDSRVTPLLSIEEVDQALALPTKFRAPGQDR